MNIAYAILHVPSDVNREPLLIKNKSYLDKYAKDLNQKAYGIYTAEQLNDYYSENVGLNIDPGTNFRYAEIGCWASHHIAWKEFYESDYDAVVIFEDDIDIKDGFFENLLGNISLLPGDWDAFFALVPEGNFSYYNRAHDIGSKAVCKAYQGNWLGAYVINKSGAEKLLSSAKEKIRRPVDIHIFYSPGLLNSYSIMPHTKMFVDGVDLGTTIHHVDRVSV
jgi:GR25 family glycosyltransferase involved in LPS biosynthesis